ncbi:hypothetical protein B0A53_01656 [Rhodotorula sp. CCFEE 5036]|nr:hypothetical protein B0A53_01656 [Rhodotorula sp. CCFEE 5036]
MIRGQLQPTASTSRLPLHAPLRRTAAGPIDSTAAGSSPSPSLSSILKPPPPPKNDKTQLSRPYYFYWGAKRVKARIDPDVPLVEVVKQLVRSNQLALEAKDAANPEAYALREHTTGELVSDRNLGEMLETATYFDLVKNPDHEARIVVRKLGSADPAALKQTTFSLRSQLTDVAFRTAFIRADGIPALQAIIRRGSGNTLAYALASLHVLLDTDGLTFDSLFIARLVDIVALEALVNVTRPATAVLCTLASNARRRAPAYSSFVDILLRQKLLLPALVERLATGDLELSDLTVDLLDQLLLGSVDTADARIPDKLEATDAWRAIAKILETNVGAPAKRFSSLHTNLRKYLQAASSAPITEDDYHYFDEIWLASHLKDVDESCRWRRLGFQTEAPQYEFEGVGLLGLKMLKRFAEDSQNEFAETLREHEGVTEPARRIPLSTISNIVLALLLSHLASPDAAADDNAISPYLFRLSDCHALAVQFFQKMWEAGEAADAQDLDRITRMTKSQIAHVLDLKQEKSWFRVRQEFLTADFATVRDRQLRELAADHALLATPKAQALKSRLYSEAYERVRRQRVAALEGGAWFRLAAASPSLSGNHVHQRGDKQASPVWRFYRLSPDHRNLRWSDTVEPGQEKLEPDALTSSVSVDSIVDIKFAEGPDLTTSTASCNGPEHAASGLDSVRRRFHALQGSTRSRPSSDRAGAVDEPLSFALSFTSSPPVQLVAPDEATYTDWVDGLCALKPGGAIVTRKTLQYVDSLADIGTRIKLLDLQDRPPERGSSSSTGEVAPAG